MMIKTVIFDIDNTLYDYDTADRAAKQAVAAYCQDAFGMSADDFPSLHDACLREVTARLGHIAASHNRLIRYQYMMEKIGQPVFPHVQKMSEIYWDAMFSHITAEKGIRDFLASIRKCGLRTGLGTNMTSYPQYRKIQILGFGSFFDFMVTSEEALIEKPAPAFFRYCLTKADCAAEECLFIGDSLRSDVGGAVNAGMKALWYTGHADEKKKASVPGEERIDSYADCIADGGVRFGAEFVPWII